MIATFFFFFVNSDKKKKKFAVPADILCKNRHRNTVDIGF